jgi:hypothetical protein
VKFKTKARFVQGVRITDPNVGTPGSWLILDGERQTIVSNEEFVESYAPSGRGSSKEAYEAAKADLPTVAAE